ncbi:MAG TPA: alpha/beta hydrolase [Frankiaceae bacterium]|nr:alpha/beta hydrolase [Frankiaceae bacterium]
MHLVRPRRRRPVPVGLVAVVAVLVTVVGGWLVRLLAHRPPSPADHGPPPAGSRTVLTEDGVPLHVELDGDPRAAFTVVLVHGFTARLGEFDRQRAALRDRARLVLYDHRGHGRSGWGDVRHATIDQLGRDLSRVLDAVVPDGPVVLVGHSMGGMTVMALAEQRPELFGPRVVGVALLATSAGRLTEVGPGARFVSLLVRLHLLRLYLRLLRWIAPLLERARRRGSGAGRAFTRRYLFGREDATPQAVRQVQDMLEETPFTIAAAFYPTFIDHDKERALAALRDLPVLVLDGADDRLTPAWHSRLLAEGIGPSAELVVVPGAGHSVNFTRPDLVDAALRRLLERAERAAAA